MYKDMGGQYKRILFGIIITLNRMIWAGPYWVCAYCSTIVSRLGLGCLVFKLGLWGSHLYIRRGNVSLEGKQEE
jgi:hypothetical protein